MNTKQIMTGMMALALCATTGLADEKKAQKSSGVAIEGIGFKANTDLFGSKTSGTSWKSNLRAQDVEMFGSVALGEKVRLKLKADLKPFFETGDVGRRLERAIEVAVIQIRNIQGLGPVAVIEFGKQSVAFGKLLSQTALYKDSPLHDLKRVNKVIGLTVKLSPKFMEGAIAATVFECGRDDLDISSCAGFAATIQNMKITDSLRATLSAMAQENEGATASKDWDIRGKLGLVYDNGNGRWTAYSELMIFDGYQLAKSSNFAATVGVVIKTGEIADGSKLVLEYSYLQDKAQEFVAGWHVPVTKHISVAPEYRYLLNEDAPNSHIAGIRARMKMYKKYRQSSN